LRPYIELLRPPNLVTAADRRFSAAVLLDLIHRLKPLDRQVIMLYLEGEAAGSIAEVTGITASNVATKIHRIKRMLKQKYLEGAADARI